MAEQFFWFADILQKELLLVTSVCFLIGAADDLVFDGMWLAYITKRKWFSYRRYNRFLMEDIPAPQDDRPLAIFVPAWQEAPVIGAMLRRCLDQWDADQTDDKAGEQDFRIYVGCYPNDEATISAVTAAANGSAKIRLIICPNPGPTSKADCLNRLWHALQQDELLEAMTFKAVVLQDAEDIVHPGALRLFGHLIGRAAMVQIPVIARRASRSRWIAGHYGDEFAEMHGKQMVLREALDVSIPSAGVGCALSRDELHKLSLRRRAGPFNAGSMTEDYELGLYLTDGQSRGIFARIHDAKGQLVATQEFFPDTLADAVRQKSRWMTGIALTGWDNLGWRRCWRENWMRLRDRKASFAAIILALAYAAIMITGLLGIGKLSGIYAPSPLSETLIFMLWINAAILLWRLAFKAYFVFNLYGLREAFMSVPRTFVANIINILAARRAVWAYCKSLSGTPLHWDKTSHFFPEAREISQLRLTGPHVFDD